MKESDFLNGENKNSGTLNYYHFFPTTLMSDFFNAVYRDRPYSGYCFQDTEVFILPIKSSISILKVLT